MPFSFFQSLPSMLTEWEVAAEKSEIISLCQHSRGQQIQLGKELLVNKAALIPGFVIFSK